MNNKVDPEKYRGLSIAALLMGVLTFIFAYPLMAFISPFIGSYLKNFVPEQFLIIFILSSYLICLPIPAIICGSIDLYRIKSGQYSIKGRGMDITGIILGSVFILIAFWFILGSALTPY